MLYRLILKVTKFQLPTPKRFSIMIKNIQGVSSSWWKYFSERMEQCFHFVLFCHLVLIKVKSSISLRTLIGVETTAITIKTKWYSTCYSNHVCHGERFCNDYFLNYTIKVLVYNSLTLLVPRVLVLTPSTNVGGGVEMDPKVSQQQQMVQPWDLGRL